MPLVRLGKIVRAIGLRGHLGVAGPEGDLESLPHVALRRGGSDDVRNVIEARQQGRLWAVKVEGISDRTAAESWVGAEVFAERDLLGDAGEAAHFWADLEGLPVETSAGVTLGRVTGLLATGAVDVLVVTGDGRERLIPLAPYVTVDRSTGKVVVDPPEGLLDLDVPGRGEE